MKHLGVNMINAQSGGAVYLPTALGQMNPVQIGIHAGADPARLIPRVRGSRRRSIRTCEWGR